MHGKAALKSTSKIHVLNACSVMHVGRSNGVTVPSSARHFFAGTSPAPEFKLKFESKLDITAGWKDKPDEIFGLVREVAIK